MPDSFSDHIDLPEIATADYNQRHVVTNLGQLIGGIRFFAQNLDHPFVEVIAHDFDDLGALRKCVAREWAVFKPRDLRVISEPDVPLPVNARVDMTIHAARYSNMTEADGRVTLFPFSAPEEACAIVEQKFSDLRQTAPDLARVLSAATPENLSDWHDAGHLWAIGADVNGARETVGLFAAAPGVVEWLEGDIVEEEIVLTAFNGHGFAASAQSAWATQAGTGQRQAFDWHNQWVKSCVSGVGDTRRAPGGAAVRVPRIGSVGAGSRGELRMSLSSRSQP